MMAVLWAVQRARRDAGVVDVGWAAGLGLLANRIRDGGSGLPLRRALIAVMAATWSFRLAWHLLTDRILGKPEDGRYQTLRARWGARVQARFFVFFQVQALVDVVLCAVHGRDERPGIAGRVGRRRHGGVGLPQWPARRSPTRSSPFRADPGNRAGRVAQAYGAPRAIRTTSSNGCTGGRTCFCAGSPMCGRLSSAPL